MPSTRRKPTPDVPADTPADPTEDAPDTRDAMPATNGKATVAVPSLDAMDTADATMAELRRAPNPYAGVTLRDDVLNAEKPKQFAGLTSEQANKVRNLIQRDARDNNVGLSIKILVNKENGTHTVVFASKSTMRKVAVTAEQIRAWAAEQNPPLPTEVGPTTKNGKPFHSKAIPTATRNAYREAHNLPVTASR